MRVVVELTIRYLTESLAFATWRRFEVGADTCERILTRPVMVRFPDASVIGTYAFEPPVEDGVRLARWPAFMAKPLDPICFLGVISESEPMLTPRKTFGLSNNVSGMALSPEAVSPISVEKTPPVTVTDFDVGVPQLPRIV